MSNSKVTINLVVLNGERYIRYCLDSILSQTYPHELIEINILDNGSTDKTKSLIRDFELRISSFGFAKFTLHESKVNFGMWPGQEELLKHSNGAYVLAMAVDVILDKNFIKNAVEIMDANYKIGALEAKIYKYDLTPGGYSLTTTIDTCGFKIDKARRVTNIGHGDEDIDVASKTRDGKFDLNKQQEIFGVEGACPFFRRDAIEDIRIDGEFCDHDYFWYGDDLDIAWRLNLFGWKQIFAPSVVAWHDRQTTKGLKKNWYDYVLRVPVRHQIPIKKRRLDWRNTRFTIVKNDYIINILKDFPKIFMREVMVLGYTALFEPQVFKEYPKFLRMLPRMLRKRRMVMRKAKVSASSINRWFK